MPPPKYGRISSSSAQTSYSPLSDMGPRAQPAPEPAPQQSPTARAYPEQPDDDYMEMMRERQLNEDAANAPPRAYPGQSDEDYELMLSERNLTMLEAGRYDNYSPLTAQETAMPPPKSNPKPYPKSERAKGGHYRMPRDEEQYPDPGHDEYYDERGAQVHHDNSSNMRPGFPTEEERTYDAAFGTMQNSPQGEGFSYDDYSGESTYDQRGYAPSGEATLRDTTNPRNQNQLLQLREAIDLLLRSTGGK